MSAEITYSGPMFDGDAEQLLGEMVKQIQQEVASVAYDEWTAGMDDHFKHNGGVYTGFAQKKDEDADVVVNDGWGETNELPYGLWLEGIGSRNAPVTRFEGYHSLRDAYEVTEARVEDIGDEVASEYVARINGE